jgi:hypothetical protein
MPSHQQSNISKLKTLRYLPEMPPLNGANGNSRCLHNHYPVLQPGVPTESRCVSSGQNLYSENSFSDREDITHLEPPNLSQNYLNQQKTKTQQSWHGKCNIPGHTRYSVLWRQAMEAQAKDWRALSEAASREQDPERLIRLVEELNRVLTQRNTIKRRYTTN